MDSRIIIPLCLALRKAWHRFQLHQEILPKEEQKPDKGTFI